MKSNKYKALFFDVDGTIFDTSEGIFKTFDAVFKKYGKEVDKSLYRGFIGPAVGETLARFFDGEELKEAHNYFRELYISGGKFRAKPYDGITGVLKYAAARYRVYTATAKNQALTIEIFKKFGIAEYFDAVYGADANSGRMNKIDVLRYALKESGEGPADSLLIGDTLYDSEGAAAVGMDCLAVLYGFGRQEEMRGKHVIGYVKTAKEIIDYLN